MTQQRYESEDLDSLYVNCIELLMCKLQKDAGMYRLPLENKDMQDQLISV